MITINEVEINEKKYLTGKIGKTNYSIESTPAAKEKLAKAQQRINDSKTFAEAQEVIESMLDSIKAFKISESGDLTTVLQGDLYRSPKTGKYHVMVDGVTGKEPIPKFFVDKMIEANEKRTSPKPKNSAPKFAK